jgi:HK97 family phage prohead protease
MSDRQHIYCDAEFRAEGGSEGMRLTGYAAVFNSETTIGGMFREVVKPGAFKKTIKDGADVRALFNHDSNIVLGRTKNGTLKLAEDDRGLKIDIDLPDTQQARDLYNQIQRGDIDQMSFGFSVVKDSWTRAQNEAELPLRELRELRLFDVSPVTFPAYATTEVQARSLVESAGVLQSDSTPEPETEEVNHSQEPPDPHLERAMKLIELETELLEIEL